MGDDGCSRMVAMVFWRDGGDVQAMTSCRRWLGAMRQSRSRRWDTVDANARGKV